jgi:hypothetical protein
LVKIGAKTFATLAGGIRVRLFVIRLVCALAILVACLGPTWPTSNQVIAAPLAAPPCDTPVNSIVAENCLAGNPYTEWDISGAGDLSIQGYATDISVNRGSTISFKIDTNATAYHLDIYRMGYYSGDGARYIATITPSAALPQTQPSCVTDAVTGLVDCGNWGVSASWTVPVTSTSGIYFAKVIRNDTLGASHIFFIVRDDAGNSDLVFQTSDTTWQAYNRYGGHSLYFGGPGGSGTPIDPSRAYKVSYNRPFTTRLDTTEDWLFNSEYPMVRWLERNGYDVSYISGIDSDRAGSLLLNHKVFLSVGHDEYWTANQRANVEDARAAGVHLAFFSGNEMFWKARWENSVAGASTPYRTLVSYKETHANAPIDPADPPTTTATWRDPRFGSPADGGRPENALTGQLFMATCCNTSMNVTAEDGQMRFWRNTSAASLAAGTMLTLPNGVLGYEWDSDIDNGSRPAGITRLSSTARDGMSVLQDYGSTYLDGRAIHSMTFYKDSSRALVFGAGTVQWSWGLDNDHDNISGSPSPAPDADMQQATVNIMADMGAQPATLQAGLVVAAASTDTTRPTSAITSPSNGNTTPANFEVTISGTAADVDGHVGGVEVSTDGGSTWHPAVGRSAWSYAWTPIVTGTVTLRSRAVDDSGNLETPSAGVAITVTPSGGCPCSIWTDDNTPGDPYENDGHPIEVGVKFRAEVDGQIIGLRFYKGTSNTGTHVGHLWSTTGTLLGTATYTGETASGWQQVTLAQPVTITANTTYISSYYSPNGGYANEYGGFASSGVDNPPLHALQAGVDGPNGVYRYDSSGFPSSAASNNPNYWVDVVFIPAMSDTTLPTVTQVIPGSGAYGVDPDTKVTATFSEALNPSTINSTTAELRGPGGALVSTVISYNGLGYQVILSPTVALVADTIYTGTLKGGAFGIKDAHNNAMSGDYVWSFRTGAVPLAPGVGPGGPILVIATSSNKFSTYYAEILRAEGFNAFSVTDISQVTPALLANFDVAILGQLALTGGQVTTLSNWVTNGGNLIAMRPDTQLAALLGLTSVGSTLSDAYLKVITPTLPGRGIVTPTIQFHGTADRYTLNGAVSGATLYSDATTATTNPAVTLHSVGSNGGQAAAFTYDLARSVVYTRQGNPAWAGQDRDGLSPVRSDDMFYGNMTGDPQPDWIDLNKVAVPQADEQQRLLANLIIFMNIDQKPLPRFWYFPRGEKAAVVMTGDNHGGSGIAERVNQEIAASASNCSVDDWECIRSTFYVYVSGITNADAVNYTNLGFEVALHVKTSDTGCADYTLGSLTMSFTDQLTDFFADLPGLPAPSTQRVHCVVWSDWVSQPHVELTNGMRLDTNYYYYPSSWIQDRPGMFTGSGFPMRFADTDGAMVDVYQGVTHMTDESGQTYPDTINALLDQAQGPNGYYGAFLANIHVDGDTDAEIISGQIISAAQAHGAPVISALQLLQWTDGRNASAFKSISWNANKLSFSIAVGAHTNGILAMLPVTSSAEALTQIALDGVPISYTVQTIKGVTYAFFTALPGSYVATYGAPTALRLYGFSVSTGTNLLGSVPLIVAGALSVYGVGVLAQWKRRDRS